MNCGWAGVMRFLEVSRTLCHHPSITCSCTQIVPVEAWGAGRETDDQTLIKEQQPHCTLICAISLSLTFSLSLSVHILHMSDSNCQWPRALIFFFSLYLQSLFVKYLDRFVIFLIVNSTLYPSHMCPSIYIHTQNIYIFSLFFSTSLFSHSLHPLHSASLSLEQFSLLL